MGFYFLGHREVARREILPFSNPGPNQITSTLGNLSSGGQLITGKNVMVMTPLVYDMTT